MSGGWSVCGLCGAVIADIPGHIYWHETGALELITEIVEELQRSPQPDTGGGGSGDMDSTEPTAAPAAGEE